MSYFKELFIFLCFWSCINCSKVISDYCDEAGIGVYEELGYKPILEENSTFDCPVYYDDSNYLSKTDKCTYRNQLYNNGDIMINEQCNRKCTCNILSNDTKSNYCEPLKCSKKNIKTDFCCADEVAAEADKNVDCKKFNGETVKFMIKDRCTECLCRKGDDKPICRKKICDTEIWNPNDIQNKCAILYPRTFSGLFKGTEDKAMCCPSRFICYEDTIDVKVFNDVDEEEEQEIIESTIEEKLCSYGGKLYTTNYALNITYYDFSVPRSALCFCKIPPLLLCIDFS